MSGNSSSCGVSNRFGGGAGGSAFGQGRSNFGAGGGNRFDGGGNRYDRNAGSGGGFGGRSNAEFGPGGGFGSGSGGCSGFGSGGGFSSGGVFNRTPVDELRGFPNFRGRSIKSTISKPITLFDSVNDSSAAKKDNTNTNDSALVSNGTEPKVAEGNAPDTNDNHLAAGDDVPTDISEPKDSTKTFTENWQKSAADAPDTNNKHLAADGDVGPADIGEPKYAAKTFTENWQESAATSINDDVPKQDSVPQFVSAISPPTVPLVNSTTAQKVNVTPLALTACEIATKTPTSIDWNALAKVTAAFRIAFAELDEFVHKTLPHD